MTDDFPKFGKIPRLHKDVVITEKIDGTNGLVSVRDISSDPDSPLREGETLVWSADSDGKTQGFVVRAGSRNRWLTVESDNAGFAKWVQGNVTQLATLGVGNHYGEWFGKGIQRGYGMDGKRFALFNIARWFDASEEDEAEVLRDFPNATACPSCCTVVPALWFGPGDSMNDAVKTCCRLLREIGSVVTGGFDNPEGLIVYHMGAGQYFKVLLENDDIPKSAINTVPGEILRSAA